MSIFDRKLFACYLYIFVTLCPVTTVAQQLAPELLYSDSLTWYGLPAISSLGQIDKNSCTDSLYWGLLPDRYIDIAYDKNGTLYMFGLPLNILAGTAGLKTINIFSPVANLLDETLSRSINAMTCYYDGTVYMAGRDSIFVYDPALDITALLGVLPMGMKSFGDLTFRHGKLLLNTEEEQLVRVDLNDPSASRVLFDLDPDLPHIYGMGTVNVSCDSVITYAMGYDEFERALYRVDFSQKKLIKVCDSELTIFGLASTSEVINLGCSIQIDLNSSDVSSIDYISTPTCPSNAALTSNPVISSDMKRIDSMRISFYSGIVDLEFEVLDVRDEVAGVEMVEDQSGLTLYNQGGASIEDFEAQLDELYYYNQNPNGATTGQRVFAFTIYSDLVCGDTSYTYLNVIGDNDLTYELDWTHPDCVEMNNGSISFTGVEGGIPPYEYSLDGNLFRNSPIFDNLGGGLHTVYVKDESGCIKWTEIELDNIGPGTFDLGSDITIQSGEEVVISIMTDVGSFDFLEWSSDSPINCSGCFEISLNPTNSTYVAVEAIDALGCHYVDSIYVTVIKSFDIYAPNVFSPNEDGANDFFYLQSEEDFVIEEMYVYARSGQLVFELKSGLTNDYTQGWSGRILEERASQGVYVWTAIVTTSDGTKTLVGDVTLVR